MTNTRGETPQGNERETQELWPRIGAMSRTHRNESAEMLRVLLDALSVIEERAREREAFRPYTTESRLEFASERERTIKAWGDGVRIIRSMSRGAANG